MPQSHVHAQTGGSSCVDTPGFSDAYGNCANYAAHKWCTTSGNAGSEWQSAWGKLDARVISSCCACGKGEPTKPPTPIFARTEIDGWIRQQFWQCTGNTVHGSFSAAQVACNARSDCIAVGKVCGRSDDTALTTCTLSGGSMSSVPHSRDVCIYSKPVPPRDSKRKATTLLFQSPGIATTFENTWVGWYTPGHSVSSGSGKHAAYDTLRLSSIRLRDSLGFSIEFGLVAPYKGKTLLSIVQDCTVNARTRPGGE